MWLYLSNETVPLFDTEDRLKFVSILPPLEFSILVRLLPDAWLSEDEVIKRLREYDGYIFNYISDNRIKEILFSLFKQDYLIREFIEVDREYKQDENVKDVNTPIKLMSARGRNE